MTTSVVGKNGTYEVDALVAENSLSRLRSCTDATGREMLFQIALDAGKNAELSRNGWALTTLKDASDEVEEQYKAGGHDGKLNYELGFPELTDSFIFDGQGSRQVNVLRFREVPKLESVIPLLKIWKGGLRVDLRTSAWILGKLLKTISFAHDNRIQVRKIAGNNVLIEPDRHYVMVFDWSDMIVHGRSVPLSIVREEIKAAAELAIKAVGGDLDRACECDTDPLYTGVLQSLATSGTSDAGKAHSMLYGAVDALCDDPNNTSWKRGFHEFTTYSLKES
jgi:serine/threonine protein kinase